MRNYFLIFKQFESGTVKIVSAMTPEDAVLQSDATPGTLVSVFPVDECTEVMVDKSVHVVKKE